MCCSSDDSYAALFNIEFLPVWPDNFGLSKSLDNFLDWSLMAVLSTQRCCDEKGRNWICLLLQEVSQRIRRSRMLGNQDDFHYSQTCFWCSSLMLYKSWISSTLLEPIVTQISNARCPLWVATPCNEYSFLHWRVSHWTDAIQISFRLVNTLYLHQVGHLLSIYSDEISIRPLQSISIPLRHKTQIHPPRDMTVSTPLCCSKQ